MVGRACRVHRVQRAPDDGVGELAPVRVSRGNVGSWRIAAPIAVLLGFVATAWAWLTPASALVGGESPDPFVFTWFLRWIPHAVVRGDNPLVTDVINLPRGANLMWNTSVPLPALVLSPVTQLGGPVFAYNVLVTVFVGVNFAAAFAFARRVCGSTVSAVVAAFLVATCPYVAGHALAHPNLLLIAFPLLLAVLAVDLSRGVRSPRRTGLLLGALITAQALTSLELVAQAGLGVALTVSCLAVTDRALLRQLVRPVARAAMWAAAVAVPLLAGPAVVFLAGPQRLSGAIHRPGLHDIDLMNLVTATYAVMPSIFSRPDAATLSGNTFETTGFVLPLVVGAVLTRAGWRRTRWATPLLVVAVGSMLFALGSTVHVGDESTGIPGPWSVIGRLPLLDSMLPGRLTVLTQISLSMLIGIGLPSVRWHPPKLDLRTAAGVGVVLVAIAGLPRWPMPRIDASSRIGLEVVAGDVVEFARHPVFDAEPMLWQAQDDFVWSIYDAYMLTPEIRTLVRTGVTRLPCVSGQYPSQCPGDLRERLLEAGVSLLIAAPGPTQREYVAALSRVLGPPSVSGSTSFWRLRWPPGRAPGRR